MEKLKLTDDELELLVCNPRKLYMRAKHIRNAAKKGGRYDAELAQANNKIEKACRNEYRLYVKNAS